MTDDQIREAIRVIRTMRPLDPDPNCICPLCQSIRASDLLASYAEAQMGRRCENCRHQIINRSEDETWCRNVVAIFECDKLGNTCGAWEPKEDTRG